MVTPFIGILTYAIISVITNKSNDNNENYSLVSICLLLSAGSFLYVATMHVLPEVYVISGHGHGHGNDHDLHTQSNEIIIDSAKTEPVKATSAKLLDTITLIIGAVTPFIVSIFIGDD